MALLDLFKPKWKHSDPKVRLKAIEEITNQQVLKEVAKNDENWEVRKTATIKITYKTILADIAKNDENSDVRKIATAKLTTKTILNDIAKNDVNSDVRKAAIKRLTDIKQAQAEKRPAPQNDTGSEVAETARKQVLTFEGTQFPLFTNESLFFDQCKKSNQAALNLPFAMFWNITSRGQNKFKAITGATRLLCSSCLLEMKKSFPMSLPGGFMETANSAKCPHCSSNNGILLWDHPDYGKITEQDMEALRDLWQFGCQLWWEQNNRSSGYCDKCSLSISRERSDGYLRGSYVICEKCAIESTNKEALSELRKNPDYWGTSELRRARNFKFNGWRFEQASVQVE